MKDIKNAIAEFNNELDSIRKTEGELEEKRAKFVADYSIEKLNDLAINEYVIGTGSNEGFCYRLENELEGLGSNKVKKGSLMYGIAVDQKKYERGQLEYKIDKEYGDDPDRAFEMVKKDIIALLKAAEKNDRNAVLNSRVYSTFKYKLLFTYFPEKYVNICTVSNALAAVVALGYELDDANMLKLYDLLSEWREKNPETAGWTNYELMVFLFTKLDLKGLKNSEEYRIARKQKSGIDAASRQALIDAQERVNKNNELAKKAEEENIRENSKKLIPGNVYNHKIWGDVEVVEIIKDKVKLKKLSDGEEKIAGIAVIFNFMK